MARNARSAEFVHKGSGDMYVWWHHLGLYIIIGVWMMVTRFRIKKLQREADARDKIIGKLMTMADRFWK